MHRHGQRAVLQLLICVLLALVWRLDLSARYYGWEEGDYGNVMMVREVADSHFTWFRTSHMPGWYSLAAIVRGVWPDPRGSALALTMLFSVLNVGIATLLTRKLLGAGAAWMVGIWLAAQPEMALYGASTLRSPVFTSVAFAGMALLIWGSAGRGFSLTAAAFLIRMEGFFTYYLPALWSWVRDSGRGLRSLLVPLAILGGVVLGWQLYISGVHGESFFLRGPFEVNLAPDVHGEHSEGFEWGPWLAQGWGTVWGLLHWTLPRKLSWTWIVLAGIGALALFRGTSRPGGRVVLAYAAFALAFWLGEGLLAHHHVNPEARDMEPCGILDPEHNLYWVWLLHAVPFLAVVAAAGWAWLERRMLHVPVLARGAILGLIIASALPAFANETTLQLERSERWYRPQLDLSTWLEEATPEDTGILTSSIPEVWLKRQNLVAEPSCDPDGDGRVYCWRRSDSGQRIYSWWTLPTSRGEMVPTQVEPGSEASEDFPSEEDFARFLAAEQIRYLIFFEEEWTDARRFAGFLEDSGDRSFGGLDFTVLDADPPMASCGYGWKLFGVSAEGSPPPPRPPAFGSGRGGRGWASTAP